MLRSTFRLLNQAALAGAVVAAAAALAQTGPGSVDQSIPPPVSQQPEVPPLHLSESQRAKVRQAVSGEDTAVTFGLKDEQPAKDFEPEVGAVVPRIIELQPLPEPLVVDLPVLKRYGYLKLKQQVLIVDPISRRIVEMFAEARG
jgi:hypothetical protein